MPRSSPVFGVAPLRMQVQSYLKTLLVEFLNLTLYVPNRDVRFKGFYLFQFGGFYENNKLCAKPVEESFEFSGRLIDQFLQRTFSVFVDLVTNRVSALQHTSG